MRKGFFIADDLSGALDTACAFHGAGEEVTAVLDFQTARACSNDAVVALTTESRNFSPVAAASAVSRALTAGRSLGRRLLFKKIDSTMRGPVAEELAALDRGLPGTRWLFTPANPAAGRTVRDGVLFVHGVPVAETVFGRDPLSPVRSSSVRALLGRAANERVVIADAESQQDLERAVFQMRAKGDPWIGVGSSALARAINGARHRVPLQRNSSAWGAELGASCAMVCGSAHESNRLQAARLSGARGVRLREIDPSADLPVQVAAADAEPGNCFVVRSERVEPGRALTALTRAAAGFIIEHQVRRIFVTGGETAHALCRALDISTLEYLEEIEPGVGLSRADSARGPLLFAVKPGGFGDPDTWIRVWDRLLAG